MKYSTDHLYINYNLYSLMNLNVILYSYASIVFALVCFLYNKSKVYCPDLSH